MRAMTRFEKVAPVVTVHSGKKGIDPMVALPEALRAIPGADEAEVAAFRAARLAATAGEPEPDAPLIFTAGKGYRIRSREQVFAVRAAARTASGAVFVREAVVRLTVGRTPPFQILAWKQGKRLPEAAEPVD